MDKYHMMIFFTIWKWPISATILGTLEWLFIQLVTPEQKIQMSTRFHQGGLWNKMKKCCHVSWITPKRKLMTNIWKCSMISTWNLKQTIIQKWISESSMFTSEKMEIGHQSRSNSSVCKLQQDFWLNSHLWPSTLFLFMAVPPQFVFFSSSVLGRVSPMKSQNLKHWWNYLSVATWWDTRRTWSLKRSVTVWFKR